MELRQLEYFLVVARREHFTQAAKELHIAQPSLSRAIGRLEAELGAPLFDRTGRQVRLNAFGQRFLRHVERACNELEDGKRELQAILDPEGGSLGLGFLHTAGVKLVPSLLNAFRKSYPLVKFQLVQDSGVNLLHQIRAGTIDLCIASLPPEWQGLGWAELLQEEIFLAVPPKHPFAGRASLCLSDAANESFVSLKPGNGFRLLTDSLCRKAGFEPKVVFEGDEVVTVRGLVGAGLGVALLPALAWQDAVGPLPSHVHVARPQCRRTIDLIWLESHYLSPSAKLFQQFVIEYFAQADCNHSSTMPGQETRRESSSAE